MTRLTLLLILALNGQLLFGLKDARGYYITKSGDTSFVTFRVPKKGAALSWDKVQWRINYINEKGDLVGLSPSTTREVCFELAKKTYTFISKPNTISAPAPMVVGYMTVDVSHIFLQLEVVGIMKLFWYYDAQYAAGNAFTPSTVGHKYYLKVPVFQKYDAGLVKFPPFKFREEMLGYIYECTSVAEKIDRQIYKWADAKKIALDYNQFCTRSYNEMPIETSEDNDLDDDSASGE